MAFADFRAKAAVCLAFGSWGARRRRFWDFFLAHRRFFFLCVLATLTLTVLDTVRRDGKEIYFAQKGALVLEVFARNDLDPEDAEVLEEKLRALEGVKEVVATSPQEALLRVGADPRLPLDAGWLAQKSADLQGRDTVLPWSYDVHCARWDAAFLADIVQRIEGIRIRQDSIQPVTEVHYDKERWALVFALHNYLRWVGAVLAFVFLCLAGFLAALLLRAAGDFRSWLAQAKKEACLAVAFGLVCGAVSHLLHLALLSGFFFSAGLPWNHPAGRSLRFQVLVALAFTLLWRADKLAGRAPQVPG